jgi:hypothetical protein
LVYILRTSKYFVDLGFHTFTLKKFGQQKRTLIKDVAIKILREKEIPIERDEFYTAILKERSWRKEGMSTIHKFNNIELYSPSFYGLTERHEENINFLSTHIPYIENYIRYKTYHSLDTTVDSIVNDLSYNKSKKDFINFILENSENLVILNTNEGDYEDYLISKRSSAYQSAKIILYAYKRKMLLSEIKLIINSELPHLINQRRNRLSLQDLKYSLRNTNKVIIDGRYFYYNTNIDKLENYGDLLNEIEITLREWGEFIHIDELYKLLKGMKNLPKSSLLLLGLLKLDERFEIINQNLVYLKGE